MNIKISNSDFELLNSLLPSRLFNTLVSVRLNEKKLMISISKSEARLIIDELTIAFAERGLNEFSEPNELGAQIEDLIDVFSQIAFSTNGEL